MKKLIIFLVFLFAAIGLQAQGDIGLTTNGTYKGYTGTVADTISGTSSTLSKVCKVNKGYLYFYTVTMDIDSLGAGTVSCILSGSNDNVNYTSITDVTYSASVDTVFNYTDVSTGVLWNFLKFTMTGDGSTSHAELQKFNVKVGKAEK